MNLINAHSEACGEERAGAWQQARPRLWAAQRKRALSVPGTILLRAPRTRCRRCLRRRAGSVIEIKIKSNLKNSTGKYARLARECGQGGSGGRGPRIHRRTGRRTRGRREMPQKNNLRRTVTFWRQKIFAGSKTTRFGEPDRRNIV
jgi:hypothetical protein